MNLYIDGLFHKAFGIGRYYESLVRGFVENGAIVYTYIPLKHKNTFEKDFKQYLHNIVPFYVYYEKLSLKGFAEQGKILNNLKKWFVYFIFSY